MGQYYFGVIIDSESRQPVMAHDGYKLHESARTTMLSFVYELSRKGSCYKQRVIWAGDYSDHEDYNGFNLYSYLSGDKEEGREPVKLPDGMASLLPTYPSYDLEDDERDKAIDEYWAEYKRVFEQYVVNDDWTIKPELRYLCDHDRKEYFDLLTFTKYLNSRDAEGERDLWENALAILCSDPTCRISGGGDYFYQEGFEYYGSWSGDVISAEPEIPEGYKEVKTVFEGKTRIWDADTISELITGEKYGYSKPSPSAYDFGRSNFHYDEKHCQLACAPREVILGMYAEWFNKIDCERVYKSFDAVMRIIKKDPWLELEHDGLTVEHREFCNKSNGFKWTDHVAIVNGVEVYLEKNDKKGYQSDYRKKAVLSDIEYHCDSKSRKYHRKMNQAA